MLFGRAYKRCVQINAEEDRTMQGWTSEHMASGGSGIGMHSSM